MYLWPLEPCICQLIIVRATPYLLAFVSHQGSGQFAAEYYELHFQTKVCFIEN